MKTHGLIFQPHSIKASLAGIKTETRRIPSPRNCTFDGGAWPKELVKDGKWKTEMDWKNATGKCILYVKWDSKKLHHIAPRIQPGDTIYVKEAYVGNPDGGYYYKADGEDVYVDDGDGFRQTNKDGSLKSPWRSPLFMPRSAARIVRTVESVGFEFLQDITETGAISEGARGGGVHPDSWTGAFADLWDSINEKRGYPWESNPPVMVIKYGKENVK